MLHRARRRSRGGPVNVLLLQVRRVSTRQVHHRNVGCWYPKRHARVRPVQLDVHLGNCLRGTRGGRVHVPRRVPPPPGPSET